MKRLFFTLSISLLPLFSALANAQDLTVAVAANVRYAFEDLKAAFEKETAMTLKPIFSSSGKLTAQIKHGAPFDVFVSADMKFPQELYRSGLAMAPPKVYANGSLVLWTLGDFDLKKGLSVLAEKNIDKVAIANPKLAPYGQAAVAALKFYQVYEQVEPKLVYGESISQVNQYVESRAVDIGLTAKSVVLSPQMKGKGQWEAVSLEAYEPIAQGAVILKHGRENKASGRFYDFLFSEKARMIFEQYGYGLP